MQIWINGANEPPCPEHLQPDLEIQDFSVGTDRELFGDFLFTSHTMNRNEITYFYDRHIGMWPKVKCVHLF